MISNSYTFKSQSVIYFSNFWDHKQVMDSDFFCLVVCVWLTLNQDMTFIETESGSGYFRCPGFLEVSYFGNTLFYRACNHSVKWSKLLSSSNHFLGCFLEYILVLNNFKIKILHIQIPTNLFKFLRTKFHLHTLEN